jgi:56kDa selenium binding protein (SBP56)
MTTWTPDPSFYPSPRIAMKAAPETLAYVAAFDPDGKTPDAIAVVDVDPKSATYSKIVDTTAMPNADGAHAVAPDALEEGREARASSRQQTGSPAT